MVGRAAAIHLLPGSFHICIKVKKENRDTRRHSGLLQPNESPFIRPQLSGAPCIPRAVQGELRAAASLPRGGGHEGCATVPDHSQSPPVNCPWTPWVTRGGTPARASHPGGLISQVLSSCVCVGTSACGRWRAGPRAGRRRRWRPRLGACDTLLGYRLSLGDGRAARRERPCCWRSAPVMRPRKSAGVGMRDRGATSESRSLVMGVREKSAVIRRLGAEAVESRAPLFGKPVG